MNNRKQTERFITWVTLAVVAFFALRLPFMVYGGAPEIRYDVLQPRYTPTPISADRAMTQQAFAMMFFTPTPTAGPTQSFFAFLFPITGPTETFTPTTTVTNTATPTRTLLPVFLTQTRVSEGGSTGSGTRTLTPTPGSSPSPFVTSVSNTPAASFTPVPSATDEPTLPPTEVETDTPVPTDTPDATNTPRDTNTPRPTNTHRPPPDTDTPEPPATDTPEPPATDTPDPTTGGNTFPGESATSSRYLMQFVFMYVLGGTFLGVVFRRR